MATTTDHYTITGNRAQGGGSAYTAVTVSFKHIGDVPYTPTIEADVAQLIKTYMQSFAPESPQVVTGQKFETVVTDI
jgi:hypothetical protein